MNALHVIMYVTQVQISSPCAALSRITQMPKSLLPNWLLHAHIGHLSKGLNSLKNTIAFSV